MSAFLSKADVNDRRYFVALNVRFRTLADALILENKVQDRSRSPFAQGRIAETDRNINRTEVTGRFWPTAAQQLRAMRGYRSVWRNTTPALVSAAFGSTNSMGPTRERAESEDGKLDPRKAKLH